ncbi:MAG: biopolymer transporter ExbD [Planctomycetota bacterium]
MRIAHSFQRRRDLEVSMTPMIDVVFLLLIFFVCTASFQIIESILPSSLLAKGASSLDIPPELIEEELERIVITVASMGGRLQLTANESPVASLAELGAMLDAAASLDRTLPVILDVADSTPLGDAIDVYDQCRLSGFQRVQFAVEKL